LSASAASEKLKCAATASNTRKDPKGNRSYADGTLSFP
jgi:hypothetical protein